MSIVSERRPMESSAVWKAADVADSGDWSVTLDATQRAELVGAAHEAVAKGYSPREVLQSAFDLPSLHDAVARWSRALVRGRGFVLIRGFPFEELTSNEVEVAYVGLGRQLGTPVGQNAHGDLLGHIRDEGVPRRDPTVRLYQTRERQDFHTDGSDIVGLLCLRPARSGGESRIASAAAVYNEILVRSPDLLEVLYAPLYWDRNGEESPGEDPYFALPVLNDVAGTPRMFFIAWYIRDAQRHADVPRLTPTQAEAIALIEEIANDPAFYLPMDFEPGDVQLLANAKILHSREAYEDYPEPRRRRHLLRFWLAAHDFSSVDDILRSGVPARTEAQPEGGS